MVDPNDFEISEFRDGSLVLTCGKKGMETDLVFSASAMDLNDPSLKEQREILEFIIAAIKHKKIRDDLMVIRNKLSSDSLLSYSGYFPADFYGQLGEKYYKAVKKMARIIKSPNDE